MLDHVTFGISEIERSQAFYDAALRPLGIERLHVEDDCAGYGVGGKAFFWIGLKGRCPNRRPCRLCHAG